MDGGAIPRRLPAGLETRLALTALRLSGLAAPGLRRAATRALVARALPRHRASAAAMAMARAATPASDAGKGRWAIPTAEAVPAAAALMSRVYGDGPGVEPYSEYKGRYLWTDAHGVCVYVALARETGDAAFLERAEALVADVHDTLGRDRRGRPLGTPEAPLAGGLRIGKVHDEDHPDGDGQVSTCISCVLIAS